jgi:uncharacterized repeat protein (TIGR01451 family)
VTAGQTSRKRGLAWATLAVVLLWGAGQWRSAPILAQANLPLDIAKSASSNHVLAGEPLYFTLTVTNTGRAPLPEVIVWDEVPQKTTFAGSGHVDGLWYTTHMVDEEKTLVLWKTIEPLAPGQAYRLSLKVTVAPGARGKIINADYRAALDMDGPAAQGPPVVVNIGQPTATPTLPTPTMTPSPSPTGTPTVAAASAPKATTAEPTPKPGGGCLAGGAALVGLGLALIKLPALALGQLKPKQPAMELREEEQHE